MVSSIGGETVFYPHDRRSAKEEIVVTPETGMLLLHKHGDDCMLVSATPPGARPMRWGYEYCANSLGSMKGERFRRARNGFSERTCASREDHRLCECNVDGRLGAALHSSQISVASIRHVRSTRSSGIKPSTITYYPTLHLTLWSRISQQEPICRGGSEGFLSWDPMGQV